MDIRIPKGRQVRINVNGRPLLSIPLFLEEQFTLNLQSDFQPLIRNNVAALWRVITTAAQAATGDLPISTDYQQFGFQTWTGTQPLSTVMTLSFYMGMTDLKNGKDEVYVPIKTLCKLALPYLGKGGSGNTLFGPGPSIMTALEDVPVLGAHVKTPEYGALVSIEVGNMLRLPLVVVKRAEPTYSTEMDDQGYPISGKVQLEINSLYTASVQMLDYDHSEYDDYLGKLQKDTKEYSF